MLQRNDSDRTWPVPERSWVMRMNWHDLLFMHYRVDPQQLKQLLPQTLEIDTFDGSAWLGIVPFRMTGVAPRFLPPVPGVSSFPELNVRTYVTINGKPGVWFFSLEATNPIAVRIARRLFHLNYVDAKIRFRDCCKSKNGTWFCYRSERTHEGEPKAVLDCEYRPIGPEYRAQPGSLAEFLTSRYCLYSADAQGNIFRGEINHEPWQLRDAQAIVNENTMSDWLGIDLGSQTPVLHFAKRIRAFAWSIKPVECVKLS